VIVAITSSFVESPRRVKIAGGLARGTRGVATPRAWEEGDVGRSSWGAWTRRVALPALLCASVALAAPDADEDEDERFHLGDHVRTVTTSSADAQKHFDRGLTLAYSFAHHAAEQAFVAATQADPRCAMAWWGIALVNGPHINFPLVLPENAQRAWDALQKAKVAVATGTDVEKALVAALERRYANPNPDDRKPLDEAYAAAMREVQERFPQDVDVATLYAEALMDLRPWDLWTAEGQAQPGTDEVLRALERAMELDPTHPGALHLFVHAVEASPDPARAVAAADRLRTLVPAASHLVHMPAHIYARVGRWSDAEEANERAIEADAWYRKQHPRPGFYALYMAHNQHFLAFAAMMRGRSARALEAAEAVVDGIPEEFLAEFTPLADGFMVFRSEVLMRFGRWEEILKEPEPAERLPLSRALWRFTRGIALAALRRLDEARAEHDAFRVAVALVPPEWTFGNNSALDILAVADRVLAGEIAVQEDRHDDAIAALREAARLEDALRYDEPPDWIQPVRHTLGAVLLTADRPAEAEAVYREDLARWPENGWSLFGLARALHLQGKAEEAKAMQERADRAWDDADVPLTTTCLCLPGK
jgi:tetratricopeptide (TPR) repeat protein